MASNFIISICRLNKKIQLKLSGDFDGSSALKLLNLMRNCINETEKIIIHTDSISHIEPFGFTGEKAPYLIKTWPDNARPEFKVNYESSYNYQNKTFKDHLFY